MILQAALLLAGLSVARGNICCPPQQFNAFQYVFFVNSTTSIEAFYYFVYDGVNQRYLITGDRFESKFVGTTKVIYDYKKRTAYSIDSVARTCTTSPLKGKFEDQEYVCIPGDATNKGPFFYGYNRDRLRTHTYTYNRPAPDGGRQKVVAVVSDEGCVPIVVNTVTEGGTGGRSLYNLGYNNLYPGIKDITIFDIPSYC